MFAVAAPDTCQKSNENSCWYNTFLKNSSHIDEAFYTFLITLNSKYPQFMNNLISL